MEIGVKEAANLLNVSTKTIYRWIADGSIPHNRVGAQYRFSRRRLQEWIMQRSIGSDVALIAPDTAEFTLSDCVALGGIHYRVGGTDVPAALHEALALTRLPDDCNRTLLWELLLAREALCSTGVGHGIALAHPRNAPLAELPHPLVSINFLESPVDFHAIDGNPVSVVILILSPTTAAHLRVMSTLSFALRQQKVLALLDRQGSRADILLALADCNQQQRQQTSSNKESNIAGDLADRSLAAKRTSQMRDQ